MRANVVFVLLILMLSGLVAGLVARGQMPHATAVLADPAPAIESDASVSTTATASSAGPARAAPAMSQALEETPEAPPAPVAPPLDRPLRLMASSWELTAPAVLANGGVFGSEDSLLARARLDVSLSASSELTLVENALARGGADPAGADVIILSLPRFVAAYERLEVLDPRIFFVVGFARGGDVLVGPISLDALERDEEATLFATAGSPAALLGLFAFDVAGVAARLDDGDPGEGGWRAHERRPSRVGASPLKGRVVLSTAQATRLVPYVAVAREKFLEDHSAAAAALVEGWLEGRRMVDADGEAAARAVADTPDGPAMLTVLNDLRLVAPVGLTDNAELMGLAGRGAVTLPTLFDRTWHWWRRAGLVTASTAPAPPLDGSIVARLARRHRTLDDDGPATEIDEDVAAGAGGRGAGADGQGGHDDPRDLGEVVITQRLRGTRLDRDALTRTIGWLAGVFPETAIEVSVHPGGIADVDAATRMVEGAAARFDVARERLIATDDRGRADTVATLRVRATR